MDMEGKLSALCGAVREIAESRYICFRKYSISVSFTPLSLHVRVNILVKITGDTAFVE